jgi:uncharacterized protein (TIGR00255 family)
MPRSMTGFGKSDYHNKNYEIGVEVKNLNNRFLDINLKLPKSLMVYESMLKEIVKNKVKRGKLTATVIFKDLSLTGGNFTINGDSIQFYYRLLQEIKTRTGVPGEITLDHLLHFKELIEPEEMSKEDDEIADRLGKVMSTALDNLNLVRQQEADNLHEDISGRISTIEQTTEDVYRRGKENPRTELDKLANRLQEMIAGNKIDQNRLELEMAIIADKVDITEECIRLKSHLEMFRDIFSHQEEVGKQLTFVLQEMQRETNTIGSKTTDIYISHQMIKVKDEIEKLREQIQNLE